MAEPADSGFGYGTRDPQTGMYERHPVLLEGNFQRPVRHLYIHARCTGATRCGALIANTFARNPKFYTHTYCRVCRGYYEVGEFCWSNGEPVGS